MNVSSVEHRQDVVLEVFTHTDVASVASVRRGWGKMMREAGSTPSQSFEYAMAAWDACRADRRVALNIVSIAVNGEVELVWPLVVKRVGLLRVANHLGCGNDEEYAQPLCRPGPMQQQLLCVAMDALRSRADVLNVWNIPVDSALAEQIEALPARRTSEVLSSPVVDGPAQTPWDAWLATRSRSFRWRLKRDRQRLATLGPVSFGPVVGKAEIETAVERLFDLKRDWLKAKDVRKSWIYNPSSRQFFAHAIAEVEGIDVFALKVESCIVSLAILYESETCVEYYMPAFDPAYASFRPGNLLIENILQYCSQKNLSFDFRLTEDSYKMRWSDGSRRYVRYVLSLSRAGDLAVFMRRFLPVWHDFKSLVKAVLKLLSGRSGAAQTVNAPDESAPNLRD